MNDFDLVARDVPGQLVRARHVERVSQRQRLDTRAIDFEVTNQRRVWPYDSVEIVTSPDERSCEIGNVTLTAAKGCCRTDLENLQFGLRTKAKQWNCRVFDLPTESHGTLLAIQLLNRRLLVGGGLYDD